MANSVSAHQCLASGYTIALVQVADKFGGKTKNVVYWGRGEPKDEDKAVLKKEGVALQSFQDFLKLGRAKPSKPTPPSPDDICTIMYTRSAVTSQLAVQEGLYKIGVIACYVSV